MSPKEPFLNVMVLLSVYLVGKLRKNRVDSYAEFLNNSPGVPVESAGIRYGVGHPTEEDVLKKPGGSSGEAPHTTN